MAKPSGRFSGRCGWCLHSEIIVQGEVLPRNQLLFFRSSELPLPLFSLLVVVTSKNMQIESTNYTLLRRGNPLHAAWIDEERITEEKIVGGFQGLFKHAERKDLAMRKQCLQFKIKLQSKRRKWNSLHCLQKQNVSRSSFES